MHNCLMREASYQQANDTAELYRQSAEPVKKGGWTAFYHHEHWRRRLALWETRLGLICDTFQDSADGLCSLPQQTVMNNWYPASHVNFVVLVTKILPASCLCHQIFLKRSLLFLLPTLLKCAIESSAYFAPTFVETALLTHNLLITKPNDFFLVLIPIVLSIALALLTIPLLLTTY